jgi:hypothetical protein
MRYRSSVAAAALLLVFVAPPVTARAQPCGNAGSLPDTPATTSFYHKDPMMGPDPLPQGSPVGPLLGKYDRLGNMPPGQWKKNYINDAGTGGPTWIWPPPDKNPDGFDTKPDGTPDRTKITLQPGTLIDRFGYAGGKFLSPVGASFPSRALPPQALDTPDHRSPDYQGVIGTANQIIPPSNYHVYCVQNAFSVDAGPIVAWFGQPGRATQYVVVAGYLPGQDKTVQWLLSNGPNPTSKYLVEQVPQ